MPSISEICPTTKKSNTQHVEQEARCSPKGHQGDILLSFIPDDLPIVGKLGRYTILQRMLLFGYRRHPTVLDVAFTTSLDSSLSLMMVCWPTEAHKGKTENLVKSVKSPVHNTGRQCSVGRPTGCHLHGKTNRLSFTCLLSPQK